MLLLALGVLHPFLHSILLMPLFFEPSVSSKILSSPYMSLDVLKLCQVELPFPLKSAPFLHHTSQSAQLGQFLLSFYFFSTLASLLPLISMPSRVQVFLLFFILVERFLTFSSPPISRPRAPYDETRHFPEPKLIEPLIDERRLERAAALFIEKPDLALPKLVDEMKAATELAVVEKKHFKTPEAVEAKLLVSANE